MKTEEQLRARLTHIKSVAFTPEVYTILKRERGGGGGTASIADKVSRRLSQEKAILETILDINDPFDGYLDYANYTRLEEEIQSYAHEVSA